MKIIAGLARGINLETPPSFDVRPTSERVRKAICDSIRQFSGITVVDLYAGSGAMGLEAASRGAAQLLLVEKSRKHITFIENNIRRLRKAGVMTAIELRCADAGHPESYYTAIPAPQLIFADPPYAESANEFAKLVRDNVFRRWAHRAKLLWEMPSEIHDYSAFASFDSPDAVFRNFEGTYFMELDFTKI